MLVLKHLWGLVAVCLLSLTGLAGATVPASPRAATFLPYRWDARSGRLLLEIRRFDEDFLYGAGLAGGAGVAEAGLDRGQTSGLMLCRFERRGPRVLLVQRQVDHRSTSPDPAQQRAVADSFPSSVRAALPVISEEAGVVLADATDLALLDPEPARTLRDNGMGEFHLEHERSALCPEGSGAFPDNTEIEALLTLSAEHPAAALASVLPDGHTLTLRVHHSFVRLPPPGFASRQADPRIGYLTVAYKDMSAPMDAPLERALAVRWRLHKADPAAPLSPPVRPLIYYLDPAIPEPERAAVREGLLWWNQAFAEVGLRDPVQVRDLPQGASLLDMRYSGVTWLHRSGRGWSSGLYQADPRTGEILHAVIRLDSHRRRTLVQLEHLLRAGAPAGPAACTAADAPDLAPLLPGADGRGLALMRLAYLVAHEAGHTLGLAHNFAGSWRGFGSLMDYYAPDLRARGAAFDVRAAYPRGVGDYDRLAIRWGYGAADAAAREQMVRVGYAAGLICPLPGDPRVARFDLGEDPVAGLLLATAARRLMLARFGVGQLQAGEPLSLLGERFALAYFYHRYALLAAARHLGGQYQLDTLAGDGLSPIGWVPAGRQRAVLAALLDALAPSELAVPEAALLVLMPFSSSPGATHGHLARGAAFNPLDAARMLAELIIAPLLDGERLSRLAQGAGPGAPSAAEVLRRLVESTWEVRPKAVPREAALRRVAQRAVLDGLLALRGRAEGRSEGRSDGRADARPESRGEGRAEVRAAVLAELLRLQRTLSGRRGRDAEEEAHLRLAEQDLRDALSTRRELPGHEESPPLPLLGPL